MELTFRDLKKRDVINIVDGASLGKIVDVNLTLPSGKFLGIFVPGKRKNILCRLISKDNIYIEERKIIKIGNDVILVNLSLNEDVIPPPPPKPNPCKKPPDCETLFGDNRVNTDDY